MSESEDTVVRRMTGRLAARDAAVLAGSIGAGVLLTFLLLSPTGAEMAELALYLVAGGGASVAVTELLLRGSDAFNRMSLRQKLVVAFAFVTALGLANTIALSAFMFVSTDHDLPMLIAILAFAGGMSIYVAYRLAERISSALQRLAEGVQSIARGELSARVPVPSEDELGAVSKSFNEMASKLEAARRRQARLEDERKQFTAALSHDLRTPLASARVMLEAVKDGVVSSPAEQAEYIRRSLVEINNLGELVDDLFELSLIDAGALRLELKPTPLQELVLSTAEGMSAAAGKKGLLLNLEVDEHIGDVIMDGLRVRRVLMNLIQNAIRYTPADGSVTVAAHDEGSEVKVEVKDTGEGIAAEDLPRIWTRTFRSDPSRTRDDDGLPQSGLGLATAKAIIELHGGWISATSQVGKGSAFTFSLPKRLPA